MTMLAFDRVVKRYGAHVALDSVSFEVQQGEVFGLLGPNGAGKTSLIRLALDIVRPDSGAVTVLGGPPRPEALDDFGYLPEERGLYKKQRVIDVLTYLGRIKGMSSRAASAAAASWLDRIGLASVAKNRVESLSKGMSQKIQLAAALLSDPTLAILDEPFSGLDPVNARLVVDVLDDRRARGKTTILSTHQMDRAESLCDRIALLDHGRIVAIGTVDEVLRDHAKDERTPTLEEVFLERIGGARRGAA